MVMVALSLVLIIILLLRKRVSIYGSITLGLVAFTALFLLDIAVIVRLSGARVPNPGINLGAEYRRLINGGERFWFLALFNVGVFAPLGFFLSEYLSEVRISGFKKQIGYVALCGLGMSICIEGLQLILRVGFFELSDLVLNTFGAVVGASLSAIARLVFGKRSMRFRK